MSDFFLNGAYKPRPARKISETLPSGALHKNSENAANSLNLPANGREYSLIFFIIRVNWRPLAGKF